MALQRFCVQVTVRLTLIMCFKSWVSIILEIIAHETIPQCPLDHRNKIDSCLECKIESETTKVSTKHLFLSKSSRVQLATSGATVEWCKGAKCTLNFKSFYRPPAEDKILKIGQGLTEL